MKTFKQYLSEQQEQYDNTIIKLIDLYKNSFKHNEKTVQQLKNSLIMTENQYEKDEINTRINQEYNRIEYIIKNAEMIKSQSLNEKLENVIKWVANRGDPKINNSPNAEYRLRSIQKKLVERE